jgi:hypothetical protein
MLIWSCGVVEQISPLFVIRRCRLKNLLGAATGFSQPASPSANQAADRQPGRESGHW